jgi:hypothetical protein
LPFLDRLASLLITDDENTHVIQFRMGALVKLVPKSEGPEFTVAWLLPPEIAWPSVAAGRDPYRPCAAAFGFGTRRSTIPLRLRACSTAAQRGLD